jgi:hypothetical protein
MQWHCRILVLLVALGVGCGGFGSGIKAVGGRIAVVPALVALSLSPLPMGAEAASMPLGGVARPSDYQEVVVQGHVWSADEQSAGLDAALRRSTLYLLLDNPLAVTPSGQSSQPSGESEEQLLSQQQQQDMDQGQSHKEVPSTRRKEIVLDDVMSGSQDVSVTSKAVTDGIKIKTGNQLNKERELVLTIKAYLDEAEQALWKKDWKSVSSYLYTLADQEAAFADLIDGLFPNPDALDSSARSALSFEAQQVFLCLEDLREAASNKQEAAAVKSYAHLLLNYDRFLKAGDLYPVYDPITSTEIFYKGTGTPAEMLRWDASKEPILRDRVLFTRGPDMGKTGVVLDVDEDEDGSRVAIVKLDRDDKPYQEVKSVRMSMLGKTRAEDDPVVGRWRR